MSVAAPETAAAFRPSQVKAQIKLKFTSALSKPAVCQRSFSLTQKPQRREYKAFEAALQTLDERNEKTTLSYKYAPVTRDHYFPGGYLSGCCIPAPKFILLPSPNAS